MEIWQIVCKVRVFEKYFEKSFRNRLILGEFIMFLKQGGSLVKAINLCWLQRAFIVDFTAWTLKSPFILHSQTFYCKLLKLY